MMMLLATSWITHAHAMAMLMPCASGVGAEAIASMASGSREFLSAIWIPQCYKSRCTGAMWILMKPV